MLQTGHLRKIILEDPGKRPFEWACLDSNQGLLPYQRRHLTAAAYRRVPSRLVWMVVSAIVPHVGAAGGVAISSVPPSHGYERAAGFSHKQISREFVVNR
jgi:hypothetical protein